MLAIQANGRRLHTVKGLHHWQTREELDRLREAMKEAGAVQCGYCTAGFLIGAASYLSEEPRPSRAELAQAMAGHICRCTGYTGILDALQRFADPQAADPKD
ncbi:(2Fe-2S)-binding protein [Kribbella ginsengisoli]|uniref:[2Fe-2S]-binding domain-containing protein n=1 Tax=Kribbella ginsengisoli TaxID=363865 RepID=A0ABP6Z798_9ACTN